MNRAASLDSAAECHNKLDDLGNGEHSTVETWVRVIFQEKYMCPGVAVRLGFIEEASISMCTQDHVTSMIDNAVIWVDGNIIK